MKKFSPPQIKKVSFPTPHTPHPTPYTLFQVRRNLDSQQFKMRETEPRG
ncbi:hypothetical protein [Microcystis sp. M169S2]|nr:hypothetical protein [Microcystis sp. M169S2]